MNATATQPKPSQKDLRLASRWIPKGSREVVHPQGKDVAVAYISDGPNGHATVLAFKGSAGHPSFHYSYKTVKQAEDKVIEFFANQAEWKKYKDNLKASRKADAEKPIKAGDYVSVTQTAKLIRAALAKRFPHTKFSVKSSSYSGGASIDIYWIDGPTNKQVRSVTSAFSGAGFDGMIDLKYNVSSWLLPDGSAAFGHSAGTGGNGGSDPAYDYQKPHPDAIKVSFGADYIFTHHEHGAASLAKVAFKVADDYGLERPEIKTHDNGVAYLDGNIYQRRDDWAGGMDLRTMIHRELEKQPEEVQ